MQQELPPPPAYTQHDPDSLHLPSVPTTLPLHPTATDNTERHLPGIKSLDLPDALSPRGEEARATALESHNESVQWGYSLPLPLNHSAFPKVPTGVPRGGSPMDIGPEKYARASSVLSMDDPDVRLAAEALSGLGNPDFVRSPASRSVTLSGEAPKEPEPILSLITSNHPWLGGTINGSISAYNASKSYSPRFVKYGAELLERNIGSPVVNTVSSVGRRTGVEKNIRRYLGDHRRPSDLEQGDTDVAHKRRRVATLGTDAMDIDSMPSPRTRGGSQSSVAESLPAYDDHRSPNYEETAVGGTLNGKGESSQDRRVNWSTQFIMTTSGLGVALSDASLKSLRLCLSLLRGATKQIDSAMLALKLVLEEYEEAVRQQSGDGGVVRLSASDTSSNIPADREEQVQQIAKRMKQLTTDIWTALHEIVKSVSHYTGGALPQNAGAVVRTQLLSLPQRWQNVDRSTAGEEQTGFEARAARRMLAFAREGLDMLTQISTVVDGTVKSAEVWLGRMGRKTAEREGEGNGNGNTGMMEGVEGQGEKEKGTFEITVGPVSEKR
ncbi:Opi1-domain-containing protein [Delitschia confertaspora ATCC 74209]|uniref:Opi1-domain-containing protein n=1 Tax=Delitschia confertaspora ATCC 74209 TaxID=1513339 RepID=A0A9P4MUR4_9PLEO|nr:Opi1-domain-containing protein [Delitschia confertaspora ATCC 74209]